MVRNETVAKRYKAPFYSDPLHDRLPLFLDGFAQLREDGYLKSKSNPPACSGPTAGGRKGRYPCAQPLFCGWCWDRHRNMAGFQALHRHLHGGDVYSFSMTLPDVAKDPVKVDEARQVIKEHLVKLGYDRFTLWIHVYGDNPAEGVKGHVDGLVSGTGHTQRFWKGGREDGERREPCATTDDLAKELGPFFPHHTPVMALRRIDMTRPGAAKDVWKAAKYAGRHTFPTLRFVAGSGGSYHRLTNVDGKKATRKGAHATIETIPNPRRVDGLWRPGDVYGAVYEYGIWMSQVNHLISSRKGKDWKRPRPNLVVAAGVEKVPNYFRIKPPEWL